MKGFRVRFAPSPTGHLHVGGARTALFNWLFARHHGGRFILRIEDTDVERSSGELEEGMLDDIAWLGLEWDEGPRKGGEYGPYRQSERISIYRQYADRLLAQEKAYPCFCTDEELERKKSERLKSGLSPRYDGSCRNLSERERKERRLEGRPESIRFIVPELDRRRLNDIIRGEVVFPPGMVGDFVIIRSNGLPTYNFAAAVDDGLMKVTHVIRGEEHLSNTLRQIMIYETLGMDQPTFAHIPLILGPDRSKLSKRHGAPNICDFKGKGYPAEAVVNYLAFLGWSAAEGKEILSVEELIREFTLDRVSESPSIFDEAKLNWVSARHIRKGGSGSYFEGALPYFPEELRKHYSRSALREIFDILSESLSSFSEIAGEIVPFRPGAPDMSEEARELIRGAGDLFSSLAAELGARGEWDNESIKRAIKVAGGKCGVKGKELFMPLRAALTGVLHGPDLASVIRIRGREDILRSLGMAGSLAGP